MLYQVVRWVVRAGFATVWPTRVEGLANVPRRGAVLVASNHLAFIDSILIPSLVPRRVVFIAKNQYFTGTGLRGTLDRAFFSAVGAVGVDRESPRAAQDALDKAVEVLEAGHAFGIYPEGTRSLTGKLYRGKTGVAWLALKTGAPIVPVGIRGTDRAQDLATNRLRPFRRLHVRFGTPIDPSRYVGLPPAQARRRLTDEVMDAIAELSGAERADEFAPRSPRSAAGR